MEIILLSEFLLFLGRQRLEIASPAGAEIDLPTPEASESDLGFLSYCARSLQFSHGYFIVIVFFIRFEGVKIKKKSETEGMKRRKSWAHRFKIIKNGTRKGLRCTNLVPFEGFKFRFQ